jgi:O-antigen/teichoic acid export membrane protein
MALTRRFLKDSGVALAGRVLPRALYLLQAMLLARWLGPELNGRYVYGFTLMTLLGALGKFGLDTLTIREVARTPEQTARYIGQNLYLHGALGLAGALLMGATTLFVDKGSDAALLVGLLGGAMLLQSLSLSYTATMAGRGRFDLQAACETLLYALMLGASAAAVWLGFGIAGVGAAILGASLLQLLGCWLLSRRVFGPADLRVDGALMRSMLALAWPLALTGIAVGIYYRADALFLALLWDDAEVGLYDAAYNFIHGLRQLPAAISLAVFPILSRQMLEDRSKAAATTGSAVLLGLAVGMPAVVLCSALAEPLVTLVYRPSYLPAAGPLRILLWTVPLMLADAVQSYLLIAAGRQRVLLGVTLLGAAVNLALNAALIPSLGMYGASVATVASEAIVLVAMQHCARDLFPWRSFLASIRAPVLGLVPLLGAPALLGTPGLAAGIGLYALVLLGHASPTQRERVLSGFRRLGRGKPSDA